MDRLVDRLLGDEHEPLRDAVAKRLAPLRLAQDQVDDVLRQRLGRLDVDAEADEPPAPRRRGERESFVMGERTDDPGRPERRARRRAWQRRGPRRRRVRSSSERAAMRAAPLARRASTRAPGRGPAKAASSPGRMRRAADQRAVSRELRPQRREVEVVPRRLHRALSAPRLAPLWTSLAGLPRQREPAGVISPFIRKASASRWVFSFIVTP